MGSIGTEFRYRNTGGKLDGELMSIDYAASAAGYGAVTYRVSNEEELRAGLRDALNQPISTLIDVKVLPKTMTHGYGAWWHVGVAEQSGNPSVQKANERIKSGLQKARLY